ncbi:MAG: Hsp20/alpha crystallin family protein [Bulleidia sp.]|nr:Hsp20/alpha crystallin family protein [Erysipelotrichaceae bacterium]MDY2781004.1 Hsp20/alpha crystallin family protein [Bulleidia sp.]
MRYLANKNSNVLDDLWDNVFTGFNTNRLMKTDVHEKDGKYIMDIDLPGYKKDDVKISLYNGNLTISAEKNESNEEKDAKGNLIRQERYSGSCSRSFYVGDSIRDNDIQASFKDGILTITVPTEEHKEETEKKYIDIL